MPNKPGLRDPDSESRHPRERMIRSALVLMGEQGVEATSLAQVLEHSGAPRGSIYHHFPGGKAQLAEDTIRHASDVVVAGMEAASGGGDPIAALRIFLAGWRYTLESSDFRAGCPIVAIAVETHERPA